MSRSALTAIFFLALLGACATQPETRFAPVDGGEIEYIVSGPEDGEPVLLLHGRWIADTFLPMTAEPVLADYRLILMHRRGYAGSVDLDAPITPDQGVADAVAVLEDLQVSRTHVVAHSASGGLALDLARQRPDVVQSVVLLETGLSRTEDAPSGELPGLPVTEEVFEQQAARMREADPLAVAELSLVNILGDDWQEDLRDLSPSALQQFRDDAEELVVYEMFAPTSSPTFRVPSGYYSEITQPVIYVRGSESGGPAGGEAPPLSEADHYEGIREVDGTGHMMLTEKPAETATVIAEFLGRHRM